MFKIVRVRNESEAVRRLATIVTRLLRTPRPILFLSSGGSAIRILDWLNAPSRKAPLAIGVLDERITAEIRDRNSHSLAHTSFVKTARASGARYFTCTQKSFEKPEVVARRYERRIREWLREHHRCRVIATMGVGADGHTAGIFPDARPARFTSTYAREGRYFVGHSYGTAPSRDRMTASLEFLKIRVDFTLLFAPSPEKLSALRRVIARRGAVRETPGRVVQSMKKVVIVCMRET